MENEWRKELRKRHTAALYGSRRMAEFSSSFPGFLQVLVDKFLIKCVTHVGFVEKVTSLSSWIVSVVVMLSFHSFNFLRIFQVVLGYSLDASPELVNQAYIVNAHVLEISPRGRSFHQIFKIILNFCQMDFFL